MLKKALSIISLSLLLILSSLMMPFSIHADVTGFDYENYYQLNYIESSGTQYINTGIAPSSYLSSLIVEADMSLVSYPGSNNALFGTARYYDADNKYNFYVGYRSSTSTSKFTYCVGKTYSAAAVPFTNSLLDTNRHTFGIDLLNKLFIFDSYTQTFTQTANSRLNQSILIFATRSTDNSNNSPTYYSSSRLYEFSMYDGSTLLKHFIPAERKSDNVIGVYDTVSNSFITNSGTGTFISGGRFTTQYVISAGVSPSGSGSVSGGGTYDSGDSVTLTATASNGYTFDHWSDGSTVNPLVTTATSDMTYTAYFVSNPSPPVNQYVISTAVNPAGSGVVTGGGTYASGSTITLTATANNGYVFDGWSDGNSSNPRSVVVSSSASYTALFVEDIQPITQYTVSASVSPNGSGSVSGTGTYNSGTTVTLNAVPNTGYVFQSWSDGIASNPRSFVLNSDVNLTAYFIDQSQIDSTLVGYNIDMIDYEAQQLLYNTGGYIIEGSNGQYQTRVTFNYSSDVSFRRIYQVDCILNNQYIGYASVSGTLIGVQFARTVYVNGNHFTFNVHIDGSVFSSTDVINFDLSHLVKVDTVQNLIENGTPDTNESASNLEDSNDIASDSFNQIGGIEDDFSEDMNNALEDINVNQTPSAFGSKFQTSAIWVSQQFNRITANTPFGSLLGFSLVLGLALLIIGKVL